VCRSYKFTRRCPEEAGGRRKKNQRNGAVSIWRKVKAIRETSSMSPNILRPEKGLMVLSVGEKKFTHSFRKENINISEGIQNNGGKLYKLKRDAKKSVSDCRKRGGTKKKKRGGLGPGMWVGFLGGLESQVLTGE